MGGDRGIDTGVGRGGGSEVACGRLGISVRRRSLVSSRERRICGQTSVVSNGSASRSYAASTAGGSVRKTHEYRRWRTTHCTRPIVIREVSVAFTLGEGRSRSSHVSVRNERRQSRTVRSRGTGVEAQKKPVEHVTVGNESRVPPSPSERECVARHATWSASQRARKLRSARCRSSCTSRP